MDKLFQKQAVLFYGRQFFLSLVVCCFFGVADAQDIGKRKLVFDDEFNYSGLPDSTKWTYEKGFVRNSEPQYYTVKRAENCRVDNGMLVIEARKETYPNAAYKAGSIKPNENKQFAQYTSASINTSGIKSWKYGRVEVRAKVPGGLGTWPAIWMLGDNHTVAKWPKCGEIDIMEFLGRDPMRVHGTVHYADSAGKHEQQGQSPVVGGPEDGFHIYAVDWNEKQVSFYYDSLKYFVFEYDKAKVNPANTFKKNFYLLLDLALGDQSNWAGPLEEKILPSKFYVDYVRIYQ
ncbi:MAG TPA: glycoside hydrolase family 16 protein [Mucilaginibacter sp.]|jgi:beta-glucanase (GH16 family)